MFVVVCSGELDIVLIVTTTPFAFGFGFCTKLSHMPRRISAYRPQQSSRLAPFHNWVQRPPELPHRTEHPLSLTHRHRERQDRVRDLCPFSPSIHVRRGKVMSEIVHEQYTGTYSQYYTLLCRQCSRVVRGCPMISCMHKDADTYIYHTSVLSLSYIRME